MIYLNDLHYIPHTRLELIYTYVAKQPYDLSTLYYELCQNQTSGQVEILLGIRALKVDGRCYDEVRL